VRVLDYPLAREGFISTYFVHGSPRSRRSNAGKQANW